MRHLVLAFSDRLYRALLLTAPQAFRERFADEMAQVFRTLCHKTYARSGGPGLLHLWLRAGWDWLLTAIYLWWRRLFTRRMGTMEPSPMDMRYEVLPLSGRPLFLAVLPFLLFGAASLLERVALFNRPMATFLLDPSMFFYGAVLTGLGAGLLAGFPRWAYSYLGWAACIALWWSDVSFNQRPVGVYTWMAFIGVFLLAVLIRRSFRPLQAMLAGLLTDWTLFSLALYILFGFLFLIYDENHHPYLLLFITGSTLAIGLGAWGYYRSTSPLRSVLALTGGLVLAALLNSISETTWDYAAYYGLPGDLPSFNPGAIIISLALGMVMFIIGLLADRRTVN